MMLYKLIDRIKFIRCIPRKKRKKYKIHVCYSIYSNRVTTVKFINKDTEKTEDIYYTDFGCASRDYLITKEDYMRRLNRKERPFTRKLYLEDINMFFKK